MVYYIKYCKQKKKQKLPQLYKIMIERVKLFIKQQSKCKVYVFYKRHNKKSKIF